MKPSPLSEKSKILVGVSLCMVAESDARMNRYTPAERRDLEQRARATVKDGRRQVGSVRLRHLGA